MNYEHSEIFSRLKATKEEASNLTTYQWLATLDFFLESSIDPIITAMPVLADNYFSVVVAHQFMRPSVKYSRNEKSVLPAMLFNSLTTRHSVKRGHQRSMLLNRGVLSLLPGLFLHTVNRFMELHNPQLRIANRTEELAAWSRETDTRFLYQSAQQCRFWDTRAREFKALLLQKYTRMALNNARHAYMAVNHRVPLDDIVQTYLLYTNKAIDRCDSRRGVLTTFIQTWLYSAKTEIIRTSQADNSVEHVEIESLGDTSTSAEDGADTHLCSLAKQADPEGILRFKLRIPEYYTPTQLRYLRSLKKEKQ